MAKNGAKGLGLFLSSHSTLHLIGVTNFSQLLGMSPLSGAFHLSRRRSGASIVSVALSLLWAFAPKAVGVTDYLVLVVLGLSSPATCGGDH